MKSLLTIALTILSFSLSFGQAYTTCAIASSATSTPISSGSCLTSQNFPGSINMSGLCVGGSNPAVHIRFVAGSCSQFTITPSGNFSSIGSQILTTSCSGVVGSLQCHDNVVSGVPFMADCHDGNGNYLLTPGTTYILRLWGPVGTSTFNICYTSNALENPSNECAGAINLGVSPAQFFNGGDCSFSGSSTDASTSDPSASALCAGSLENTQWIKFMPTPGVTSFQIIGSNINCTGGGCGFQFGILSGICGSLVAEGCYGNKVCSGGQSVAGPTNVSSTDGFIINWTGTTTTGFTATITRTGGVAFTGAEVFYLVMDGNADADCQYTLQGVNIQALPIELLEFSGESHSDYNKLYWSTATEVNNSYFEIDRSIDGINWQKCIQISGNGNSTETSYYDWRDYSYIKEKINYYRLSQTDFDGKKEYFNIIAITRESGKECNNYEYYNTMGGLVDFKTCSSGIYLRRCLETNKVERISK